MAKTSIRPESEEPITGPSSDLVPAQPSSLPEYYDPGQYDDVSRDISVPVIGLVNKIGPLSKTFPKNAGEFAFADQFVIGETVKVIPIGILKFFVEKVRDGKDLKFGSPEAATAKIFATANEAARAGYAVDFDDVYKNRVEEASRVAYLVVAPEGDSSGEFVEDAAGIKVALCKSSYQRGGHRGVFRPLVNHAAKLAKAQGLPTLGKSAAQLFADTKAFTHFWTLSAEHREDLVRQLDWFEPRISKGDVLPPEVFAWIESKYDEFKI
jgi:hypothetical protein